MRHFIPKLLATNLIQLGVDENRFFIFGDSASLCDEEIAGAVVGCLRNRGEVTWLRSTMENASVLCSADVCTESFLTEVVAGEDKTTDVYIRALRAIQTTPFQTISDNIASFAGTVYGVIGLGEEIPEDDDAVFGVDIGNDADNIAEDAEAVVEAQLQPAMPAFADNRHLGDVRTALGVAAGIIMRDDVETGNGIMIAHDEGFVEEVTENAAEAREEAAVAEVDDDDDDGVFHDFEDDDDDDEDFDADNPDLDEDMETNDEALDNAELWDPETEMGDIREGITQHIRNEIENEIEFIDGVGLINSGENDGDRYPVLEFYRGICRALSESKKKFIMTLNNEDNRFYASRYVERRVGEGVEIGNFCTTNRSSMTKLEFSAMVFGGVSKCVRVGVIDPDQCQLADPISGGVYGAVTGKNINCSFEVLCSISKEALFQAGYVCGLQYRMTYEDDGVDDNIINEAATACYKEITITTESASKYYSKMEDNSAANRVKKSLDRAESDLERARITVQSLSATRDDLRKQYQLILTGADKEGYNLKRAESDIEKMSMYGYTQVLFNDNGISGFTDDVVVRSGDVEYDIGRLVVNIPFSSNDSIGITIRNLTRSIPGTMGNHQAPHVWNGGTSICWGDARSTLDGFIKEKKFADALCLIRDFLNYANANDGAGRSISMFPKRNSGPKVPRVSMANIIANKRM